MNICRALRHASAALSVLPKCVREIRLDKIGFDVLADTHDVCYALCLKNWQLDEDKGRKRNEPRDFVVVRCGLKLVL